MSEKSKTVKRMSRGERADRRKRILTLLKGGADIALTADEFGMSYTSVYAIARAAQLQTSMDRKKGTVIRVISRLLNTGDSLYDIAKDHGVSARWVEDVLDQAILAGIVFSNRERKGKPT